MNTPKVCRDCKFCSYTESSRDGKKEYYCKHPNNISIITGEINAVDCSQMRYSFAMFMNTTCGYEGRWFVHKDDEMHQS